LGEDRLFLREKHDIPDGREECTGIEIVLLLRRYNWTYGLKLYIRLQPKARPSSRTYPEFGFLASSSVVRDVDSLPVVVLSAEQAKHVGDEENQQYRPQSYTGPAARTPAGMAVVPSTEAKNQY